ncbi:MAG: hypothetical protein J7J61_06250 [Candidatus Hydrothermae bacterium]|nr:hypothetical protein [Candidatus Hydrothermae bacterium]
MMYKFFESSSRLPVKVSLRWSGYWKLFIVPDDIGELYENLKNRLNQIDSEEFDKFGFYMLLTGKPTQEGTFKMGKLLYIGQAYNQKIGERIPQSHPGYECIVENHSGEYLYLAVSEISRLDGMEKITQELFDDIECCLIYKNKPLCNTDCVNKYNSKLRRVIQITNTYNYSPLKEKCECK